MHPTIETLRGLGQGQRVRLQFEDGNAIALQVNQMEYVPFDCLRLELTGDGTDDNRYQAEAHIEGGEWTAIVLKRYDRANGAWSPVQEVSSVTPLQTFRTMKSDDMEAQENTGSRSSSLQ